MFVVIGLADRPHDLRDEDRVPSLGLAPLPGDGAQGQGGAGGDEARGRHHLRTSEWAGCLRPGEQGPAPLVRADGQLRGVRVLNGGGRHRALEAGGGQY